MLAAFFIFAPADAVVLRELKTRITILFARLATSAFAEQARENRPRRTFPTDGWREILARQAQTGTPQKSDPLADAVKAAEEAKATEDRKAKQAEDQKTKDAEAERIKEITSAVASISSLADKLKEKGPATTLKGTEAPIESLALAYEGVASLADKIAQRIVDLASVPECILMYSAADVAGLATLTTFKAHIDLFVTRLGVMAQEADTALAAPPGASTGASASKTVLPLATAISVFGAALNVASLFRVSNEITYSTVEVTDRTLATAVAGALKAKRNKTPAPTAPGAPSPAPVLAKAVTVYDSALAPVGLAAWIASSSKVVDRLSTAITARSGLQTLRIKVEASKKAAEAAATVTGAPAAIKQRAADLLDLLARLDAVIAEALAYEAALLKADDAAATSRLSQLIAAEALDAAIGADANILLVKSIAAKGAHRETKTFFSSELSYSGGAIVSFALSDRSGGVVDAGVLVHDVEFRKWG